MTKKNGYDRDFAVKRVKRLPRNRNVPKSQVRYSCAMCPFSTLVVSEAWFHSYDHGPWPVLGSANLAPLPVSRSPSYNNGKQVTAIGTVPSVRRV